ncbi:MAG: short-subunit dehydrogenase [Myxococcota bacterium]|jgi:short-subunit dehydrogenase
MSKVVLVTGASTGLGLAIARQLLARTDHRLVLTARASSLSRFGEEGICEGERVMLCALDVTDGDQRRAVTAAVEARWGGVDVLINNAGVSYRSVVEHVSAADRQEQLDINFSAPMELARLVLPGMRARRRGHIINISSVGGMMAMPTMGVYSASKFALEGASEALWYEVRPWDIFVTLVEPGFIRSSSFQKVRLTRLSQDAIDHRDDDYHAHYRYMGPFIERMMSLTWATPERIAGRILRLLARRRPPLRLHVTPDAWIFSMLRRVLPRDLYHWLLYVSLPHIRRWGPRQPSEAE